MGISEVIRMAVHNLWQRRVRTLFNLTGIVLGCIVLLMTAAAASGIRTAVHALFDSTDFVRQTYIFPGGNPWKEPPEGAIVIDADISDARKKRIRKALAEQWNAEQKTGVPKYEITLEDLDSIREMSFVDDVVPEATTGCLIKTDTESFETGIGAMCLQSSLLRDSVLAGALPGVDDREGVLVNEFLAWRMGYRNDQDLSKIVGQPLKIEYRVSNKNGVASIYNLLAQKLGEMGIQDVQRQTQFFQSLRQLTDEMDKTTLTEDQKALLRTLIGVGLQPSEDLNNQVVTRQFVVRGIVHSENENPVAKLFRQWFHGASAELQVQPEVAIEIFQNASETKVFRSALVFVESSSHLQSVTDALKAKQFNPQSSLWILDSIDVQIDRNAWVVYGIALAILLTAAVGISNTLILSIVERTPEFGIMKSVGAKDSCIVKLMIAEGAILGLVGAAFAILLSLLIGFCGQPLLKMYVESRVKTELTGSLFQFQLLPAIAILLISVLLCVIASLLPAWRAARLDPVVAMRRT